MMTNVMPTPSTAQIETFWVMVEILDHAKNLLPAASEKIEQRAVVLAEIDGRLGR
jgi:hypothetical protein